MMLSAPTKLIFLIAVVIAILALVVQVSAFSVGIAPIWIMTVAFIVLAAGNLLKGV